MSGTGDEQHEYEHSEDERFEDEQPPLPHPLVRKPMKYFANPRLTDINMGIRAPRISADSFEIKPSTIQLVQKNQFGGAPNEDPYAHIRSFEKVCNTFKAYGVSQDAIKLRLFPFSLRDRAATWEQNLTRPIHTWDELVVAFLQKFFPPGRTTQLMAEITHFAQWDQESLYEAWERYKDMLRKCPHHGLNEWMVIQTFFSGLHPQYKNEITAAAGGALMNKTYEEAIELIENLSEHSYATPRSSIRKVVSVHESKELKAIKAQLETIANQLKGSTVQPPPKFDSNVPEPGNESQSLEQVYFGGNLFEPRQQIPYPDTYKGERNKSPNFELKQQQQHNYRQKKVHEVEPFEKKPGLEDIITNFMTNMDNAVDGLASSVGKLSFTVDIVKSTTDKNTASIEFLERQVGQIVEALKNARNVKD